MYSDPLDILTNMIAFSFYFTVCHLTMTRRYSFWITLLFEIVLFTIHILIGNVLPYGSIWRMIYWPILHVAILSNLYLDRWYRITAIVLLLILSIWLNEILGILTFYTPEMLTGDLKSGPLGQRLIIRLFSLIQLSFILFLLTLILNRRTMILSRTQYMQIICFPFSIILFLHFWITSFNRTLQINYNYMLFALITCIISFVFYFFLSIRTTEKNILESENRRLSEQIEFQYRHYERLSKQYAEVRLMRHDIAKHMSAIQSLLAEGRSQEASVYFDQVKNLISSEGYHICQHPIVDALLHYYADTATSAGIRTDFTLSVPSDLSVASTDLICAFGNLLDNALKACSHVDNPSIVLHSALSGNYFLINLDNTMSFSEKVQPHSSTHLQRGLGTEILCQLASKYDGNYSFYVHDGLFHAELSLKAGDTVAADRNL